MDFTYQAVGGPKISGCANYKLKIFRYYLFGIGSIVFVKAKAMKGIFEKIAIKKVTFHGPYINLYFDTFNAAWNENELVSYDNALILVNAYIEQSRAEYENRKC